MQRQSLGQITPFLASLCHTSFDGDICLMIEDMGGETIERLRALGVIVERSAPSAQQSMATMSSRYFSCLDFLIRRGDRYANVMLADPSTCVFQADPFAAPLPVDIVYASERLRVGDVAVVRGPMAKRSQTMFAIARPRTRPPRSARCRECCAILPR